mgnify:CR=1 FL=1
MALMHFLEAWKARDWKEMAKHTQLTWNSAEQNSAEALKVYFGKKQLREFTINREVEHTTV